MAFRCRHPTCPNVVKVRGYCPDCAALGRTANEQRGYDQLRRDPLSKAFYDSARWRRVRAFKLARNPVCERCGMRLATTVHHVREVRDVRDVSPELLTKWENFESLCASCHVRHHNRKH